MAKATERPKPPAEAAPPGLPELYAKATEQQKAAAYAASVAALCPLSQS